MGHEEVAWVENLKNRDSATIEMIVKRYTLDLYRVCVTLGFKKSEAEDITQSVWITFFDVINRFEGRSSIRTFLFGILYNKASEFRRQNYRSETSDEIDKLVDSYFDTNGSWLVSRAPLRPDMFLEAVENMNLIRICLEFLPLNQKMAFLLKEVEEEPTEDICAALNVKRANLGVLLFRAKNQLRSCIEGKAQ